MKLAKVNSVTGLAVALVLLWIGTGIAGDWVPAGTNIYYLGGKVGIGTDSPGEMLEVSGNIFASESSLIIDRPNTTGGWARGVLYYDNELTSGTELGGMGLYGQGTSLARMFLSVGDDPWLSKKGIQIKADNGYVGIGTLTPGQMLEVSGNIFASESSLIIDRPNTTGGWAKGVLYYGYGQSSGTELAGMGLLGEGSTLKRMFLGFGDDPWGTRKGIQIMADTGNVGIGTAVPQTKLAVAGTITAREINVTTTGWADYVFEEGFSLKPLEEVESFIQTNKHLPDIPSGEEIEEKGLSMGDMMAKQMAKIEELTLYLIELKKENESLKKRVAALEQ